MPKGIYPKPPIEERFWSKVKKSTDCWIWTDKPGTDGYGKFKRQGKYGKTVRAHRFSWEIVFGQIPIGMLICHTCDNRLCVKPQHLFLGTHNENMKDMIKKGRQAKGDGLSMKIKAALAERCR